MAVNAISAISMYYPQYVKVDYEYEEIKKKLMALGKKPSGSKVVDAETLIMAQKEHEIDQQKKVNQYNKASLYAVEEAEKEPDQFLSILRRLYVKGTGDIELDYRTAIKALRTRMETETNHAQINELNLMKNQLDRIMANLGYSIISIPASEMTGANAIANLNKVMMVDTASTAKK